jgi:hypothetical protein
MCISLYQISPIKGTTTVHALFVMQALRINVNVWKDVDLRTLDGLTYTQIQKHYLRLMLR